MVIRGPRRRSARRSTLITMSVLVLATVLPLTGGTGPGGAHAAEHGLEDGDLVVGDQIQGSFGYQRGKIVRIRDGAVETFCESPEGTDPEFWNVPEHVIVDSQSRVVFLAYMGSTFFNFQETGLFRCDGMGSTPELLAVLPWGDPLQADYPLPFGDDRFSDTRGLHLARVNSATIDDSSVHAGTEDAYVFAALQIDPDEIRTLRYFPSLGIWDEAPPPAIDPLRDYFRVDMVNVAGATYSVNQNVLGRTRDPLEFRASGSIGGLDFSMGLQLFGGTTMIGGGPSQGSFAELAAKTFLADERSQPNPNGGCDPGTSGISPFVPRGPTGAYTPISGLHDLAVDESLGIVVRSDFGGLAPYMARIDTRLLDDDPSNDRDAQFLRPEYGCLPQRLVEYDAILPVTDPDDSEQFRANGAASLVSNRHGVFGTQRFIGRVVRVTPGDRVQTVASGLTHPMGLAAVPHDVAAGTGTVLAIRIDSPVDVLVTAPDGRRLGVDATTGDAANDFGPDGFDSGPGEPRILAIKNPAPGEFSVASVGTGEGPYTIHAYAIDLSAPVGEHIATSGTATLGGTGQHDLTLTADAGIAFVDPPATDTTPPVTTATADPPANDNGWNNTDVAVALDATDEDGGSGVQGIAYTLTGAQTAEETVVGDRAELIISAEGETTVAYSATDHAGNTEAIKELTVRIDKTPPDVDTSRTPEANANGWNNTDVTVGFQAIDALSGIDGDASMDVMLDQEGADQQATATFADRAGNTTTATVGHINIDQTAPKVSCTASPDRLWPPNHLMVDIETTVDVTDVLSGPAAFILTHAVSDEPDDAPGGGDGHTTGDIRGWSLDEPDTRGQLRAERDGRSDGRTYTLSYHGSDRAGNIATCDTSVFVARDARTHP